MLLAHVDRVLLMEDQALLAIEMSDRLCGWGVRHVDIAHECAAALQMLEQSDYALVIAELRLRETDTSATLVAAQRRHVPVLLCSAYPSQDLGILASAGWVSKPVDEALLLEQILAMAVGPR